MSVAKKTIKVGGADTYTIRDATLVTNYYPGPMRENLRQDATLLMGAIDFGTFGNDEYLQGPGTYAQAIPNLAKYQPTEQIFAVPSAPPNKMVAIDSRQLAGYQVQQLKNNPLSIYSNNLNGPILGFECSDEPDDYSNMLNKRGQDLEKFFDSENYEDTTEPVYPKYSNISNNNTNPNANVVFNLNYDTESNPFISLGAPNTAKFSGDYSAKCYSGYVDQRFENSYRPRDFNDLGMTSYQLNSNVCEPNNAMMYANPLVLQKGQQNR